MRTFDQIESMAPASERAAQRFPQLTEAQLETIARFADAGSRKFAPGEPVFQLGECGTPAWFILEGSIELFGRDGLDQQTQLRMLESGQFTGELHQLTGGPALAGAVAGKEGCSAIPFDAARLRALIVGSAELGEMIMRAFILRRVSLLERGVGPVLLGRAGSADLLRLQTFLSRNAYPHLVIDCSSERRRRLLRESGRARCPGRIAERRCPRRSRRRSTRTMRRSPRQRDRSHHGSAVPCRARDRARLTQSREG
jgi:thioredoxin reductase (NADPH)